MKPHMWSGGTGPAAGSSIYWILLGNLPDAPRRDNPCASTDNFKPDLTFLLKPVRLGYDGIGSISYA